MIRSGESFFIPGSTGEIDHLIIVITDWDAEGDAVAVNLTDYENVIDPVIEIPAGTSLTDRFTTTKKSTINYAQARRVRSPDLEKIIRGPAAQQMGTCDLDWLQQIREQVFASPYIPDDVLDYCEAFDWGLP